MTAQERFAEDWGMPLVGVQMMVETAMKCGRCNEAAVNGDRHRNSDNRDDKNANTKEWLRDLERQTEELLKIVKPYGFTAIAYTGLGPTLRRGDRYVEIPY
jgi:hypothetical protein